ncbi:hypothetical protein JHL22_10255 [Advenella sp. WQ 585]|uniref:XRE family transcriptional regulator n=1 Tax=Advenella mandrilli TaxID=2800330 RepID=A0ABS1EFT8_9BURK|nr:hypothetical protein [Advenella mandrilli]MBK1781601.1 hypothetical protein [Advenella mandrilli]
MIRRTRLRQLIDERADGVIVRFAEMYEYSKSQIGQYLSTTYNNGKSIGDKAARAIEQRLGLEPLWLDGDQHSVETKDWPFIVSYDDYMSLSEQDKNEVNTLLKLKVDAANSQKTVKKTA